MPQFSKDSLAKLATCHADLQTLFMEVIKHYDCTIICGARSDEDQIKAFKIGASRLDGVKNKSKHQVSKEQPLSMAVDVAPYPIDWKNNSRFYHFGGFVLATATRLGINIRWGGDWNGDNSFADQKFNDLPHFELK